MKKYLGITPTPREVHSVFFDPAVEIIPTTSELTFDDSFFEGLPEMYEPEGDDVVTQVPDRDDNDNESVQLNENQAEL